MRAYDERTETRTIYDCAPALRRPAAAAVQAIRARFAGKLLFGQVGQLDDAMKGQRLTIAAACRLESLRPNILFLLIGEGRDEQALKAEAGHMSNVQFTGWRADIEDYYAALDTLVFPSRSEGLGSAILEAMSFGIPVVAAAVGGIPEVIEPGSNGILFAAGDVEELTAQLTRVADAAELRRELGRRSVLTAALMSPERMAEQYFDLYRAVVAEGYRR
jgi:glycosyltransferase involved in cell wall biosynthesis